MKGVDRVSAIDASTPRMLQRLPDAPIEAIRLFRLMRATNQALTGYFELLLRPIGFTESMLHALFLLFASDDGTATPGALCELVGQTKANMTRILETLASKHYVSRTTDESDGRRHLIRITGEGKRLVRRLAPVLSGPLKLAMTEFSKAELKALDQLLRRVVTTLDRSERQLRASV